MGSFNVSCAVTGYSMCGNKVAFIPLTTGFDMKFFPQKEGCSNFVPHMGSVGLFAPATLPIFGTIRDYGEIDDIEKDENTKWIELKTGMKIEKFIKIISNGDDKEKSDLHKKMESTVHGAIIHRDVWDLMSSTLLEDDGKSSYKDLCDYYVDEMLFEEFWFTETEFKSLPNYKTERKFTSIVFPGVTIEVKDVTTVIFRGKTKRIQSWRGLIDILFTINPTVCQEFLDFKNSVPSAFFSLQRKILNNSYESYMRNIVKFYKGSSMLDVVFDEEKFLRLTNYLTTEQQKDIEMQREHCTKYRLNKGYLSVSAAKLQNFIYYLQTINKLLMPSYSGCQFGNHHATKKISELTLKLSKDAIKHDRSKQ